MIKKVTVTSVFKNETNKDGVPYSYKNGVNAGKTFTRVVIKTDATGDQKYGTNALPTDRAMNIEQGQSYVLKLESSKNAEGTEFFNWTFQSKKELEVYEQFAPKEEVTLESI